MICDMGLAKCTGIKTLTTRVSGGKDSSGGKGRFGRMGILLRKECSKMENSSNNLISYKKVKQLKAIKANPNPICYATLKNLETRMVDLNNQPITRSASGNLNKNHQLDTQQYRRGKDY